MQLIAITFIKQGRIESFQLKILLLLSSVDLNDLSRQLALTKCSLLISARPECPTFDGPGSLVIVGHWHLDRRPSGPGKRIVNDH